MEDKTFRVRKSALGDIERQFAKLNRRANKIGVPEVSYEVIEEYHRKLTEDPYTGAMLLTEIYIPMVVIKVQGEAPKFEGWTFLGTLEHTESGNLLKSVPGQRIPEDYRHVDRKCDHCKLKRIRKDTFVVSHEDGRTLQVGRQCVRDFLGHKSPENIVKWADFMIKLNDGGWEDEYGFGGVYMKEDPSVTLEECLNMSAAVIREFGWVSASKAEEEWTCSTKERVYDQIFNRHKLKKEDLVGSLPADEEIAAKAREWAKNIDPKGNDYLGNIKVIADNDFVQVRQIGIACSIISSYKRTVEKFERKKANFKNEHFGEPKERLELTVKVLGIYENEGYYGVTWIHKMVTDEGHKVTWFCSSYNGVLEQGEAYKVKATVKRHSEWQGWNETHVNRVTVIEDLDEFKQKEFEPDTVDVEKEEEPKQVPGEISFYKNSRTKMIRVYCSDCKEWMDEKEVSFENIEEDFQGRDILTFKCSKCKNIQQSLRVG
jgi:hypothetical protein